MDTIFFKKTIVKKLFHFLCTVALLLSGITAFAQGAPAYKAVVKGDFELIGNRSDAPYILNIPQTDPNCPVNIKWARLYTRTQCAQKKEVDTGDRGAASVA